MKKFIYENLTLKYKKSIGLNASRLKENWFNKNGFSKEYNNILRKTYFLKNVSLSERIYCIVNNITCTNSCPYCGKNVKYTNFIEGYRRHCGNRKCSYIDKATFKDDSGLTANEKSAIGISISQNSIEQNGKTKSHNSGIKSAKTKRNTIISGITLAKLTAIKAAKTKMNTLLPNGLTIAEDASIRASKTMNEKTISGKTLKEIRIEKGIITKRIIDDNGLDGFDKAFLNGAGKNSSIKFYDNNLFYQGSYEKHFLDYMFNNNIKNIKRGERFNYYFKNKNKQYRSDFMLNDIIFEIKSSWTYGKKDENRRNKNHSKFKSVINRGFKLFVIFDKKYFVEVNEININNNLYTEKLNSLDGILPILKETVEKGI